MRIYISGPVTGMPDLNRPAFIDAATALRRVGYEVVNPLDNGLPESASYAAHMCADIRMLLECDAIALLLGWEKSRGANLERYIAAVLGMEIGSVEHFLILARQG